MTNKKYKNTLLKLDAHARLSSVAAKQNISVLSLLDYIVNDVLDKVESGQYDLPFNQFRNYTPRVKKHD